MTTVRTAVAADLARLGELDANLPRPELASVVDRGRVLVAGDPPAGLLRWGLLWDEMPMMNLLYVDVHFRAQGVGRELVSRWEDLMRSAGHSRVLTSTRSDESAQHFYRRLGYTDVGGFVLPGEPWELILLKELV